MGVRGTTADGGPFLGAHMSIAGGIHLACQRGRSVGCDAIQVFTKSPTQWKARPLTGEDERRFREARERYGIRAVIAHDTYLINLAAPDPSSWRKSIAAFADELARCHLLGIGCMVTHPGSHQGKGVAWGVRRVAEALNRVLDVQPPDSAVAVLLETTAGMGSSLGRTFEELAEIRCLAERSERTGFCLDTAHIYAAGYDFRTPEGYERVLTDFDRTCGLRGLRAIHFNDSKKDLGTLVDRHERIGRGKVGKDALIRWATDARLAHLPMLLETHGGMEAFKTDLRRLRRWVREERVGSQTAEHTHEASG